MKKVVAENVHSSATIKQEPGGSCFTSEVIHPPVKSTPDKRIQHSFGKIIHVLLVVDLHHFF